MKIIETKVYNYDELSEKAKQKARDWFTTNLEFSPKYIIDIYTKKLEALGFYDITIHYSGFYSQGDGAMFQGNWNKELFNLKESTELFLGEEVCYIKLFADLVKIETVENVEIHHFGHYYHYNSKSIQYNFSEKSSDSSIEDAFEKDFNEVYVDLCKDLYQALEKHYEDETSECSVEANTRESEYTFTENGTRFG